MASGKLDDEIGLDNSQLPHWYEQGIFNFYTFPKELLLTNPQKSENLYGTCKVHFFMKQNSSWFANPSKFVRHLEVSFILNFTDPK